IQHTITSGLDSWLVHFSYFHSTHSISINLGQTVVPEDFSGAIFVMVMALSTVFTIVFNRKRSLKLKL
ncbi:MAG: hypothetical protein ACM3WQ_04870, partial [Chloroflexota bacterium]